MLWGHHGDTKGTLQKQYEDTKGTHHGDTPWGGCYGDTPQGHHEDGRGTPWRHHGDTGNIMKTPWGCQGDTMGIPWGWYGTWYGDIKGGWYGVTMGTPGGQYENIMGTPRGHHGGTKGMVWGRCGDRDSLAGHLQDLLDGAVTRGHEVLRVLGHPDGLQPLGDGAEGDTLRATCAGQADGDPGKGWGGARQERGRSGGVQKNKTKQKTKQTNDREMEGWEK